MLPNPILLIGERCKQAVLAMIFFPKWRQWNLWKPVCQREPLQESMFVVHIYAMCASIWIKKERNTDDHEIANIKTKFQIYHFSQKTWRGGISLCML